MASYRSGKIPQTRRRPSHAQRTSIHAASAGENAGHSRRSGLTQAQTFSTAYATVWCVELRPEAARTAVLTQGHSLNRYRVNNVVSNMPQFAHASAASQDRR